MIWWGVQVDATLSHVVLVVDVLNFVEIVEFGLTLVGEIAAAVSFWINCVDLPTPEVVEMFPSSVLAGKKMRISAGVVGMSICVRGVRVYRTQLCRHCIFFNSS